MDRNIKDKDDSRSHSHSGVERESHKRRRHRSHSKSRSRSRERTKNDSSRIKKVKEDKPSSHNSDFSAKEKDVTTASNEERPVANSTNDSSISIEETNRIRAELGLKPLDVGGTDQESSTEKKDVHVPAENLREKKKTEDLRRKFNEIKEKRQIEQRFARTQALGVKATDEEDNAANWVERSRRIQKEKEEAAKRSKMLEEMDEAFGLDEAVTSGLTKQKAKAYTSKDLRGLKVEHDRDMISEGSVVVLTLKDQNILQEDGDVLVNVNLLDAERYNKNNEIKKQKPGYQAYEDEEFDEFGLPKTKSLLAKYDVEIDGHKKESFVLGKAGDEEAKLKAKMLLKDRLQLQQKKIESLEMKPLQIASEYYTSEEMSSFKKVKRRVKKIRPKSDRVLKADDLLQDTNEEPAPSDLGSRSRKSKTDDEPNVEDLSNFKVTIDDSQREVKQALSKVNKLKMKKPIPWDMNSIAMTIKREPSDESEAMEEDPLKSAITLNATAEFCRTLGDIPTYGMAGNRDEDEDELMDFERQLAEERRRNQEKEERKREAERLQERGGWNVLKGDNEHGSDESMDVDSHEKDNARVILDEEPDVGSGMAAALKLAMSKGYLEKEEKKRIVVSKAAQELQAQRYTIEDKAAEDDKHSRRTRFDGPVVEFKEKDGYKPVPKLEYIDDNGKAMSTKEAFRHLSHKFHGKGSGKLKSEKRAKKDEDKMLMNRMSSTDTPLNTLKKLQDKQKELQSPYVVLSGKMATTSITKPGKGKK